MESIADIKEKIKQIETREILKAIAPYLDDQRAGVKAIVNQAKKRYKKHLAELQRLDEMKLYERKYHQHLYICGIDEAGRGPLCGPVVAAAVILPKDVEILYLNDSKKVPAPLRERLYDEIMEKAIATGVGYGSVELIENVNILNATYQAMSDAIDDLGVSPEMILVDAVRIPYISQPQESIVRGDEKSISIAAASIIAKVTRDRMMVQYHQLYPEYDLISNKGYGTTKHIEALKQYGSSPIHRQSFIKNFIIGQ